MKGYQKAALDRNPGVIKQANSGIESFMELFALQSVLCCTARPMAWHVELHRLTVS